MCVVHVTIVPRMLIVSNELCLKMTCPGYWLSLKKKKEMIIDLKFIIF